MGLFQALNTVIQMVSTTNSSPVSGQVWFDGTHMQVNLGGTTYQLDRPLETTGSGTLVGGTVTISTTVVTASSKIFLTGTWTSSTSTGSLSANTIVAGTSFKVNSSNILDTETFNWLIIG